MLIDILVELGEWSVRASYQMFLIAAGMAGIGSLALLVSLLFGGLW